MREARPAVGRGGQRRPGRRSAPAPTKARSWQRSTTRSSPGGGDYPGNEFIIGSGADALLCRYKSGRRRLDADDQITLEFAGSYRHYHAAIMRTVVVGRAAPAASAPIMRRRARRLRPARPNSGPGRTAGDVYAAHVRVLDAHGLAAAPPQCLRLLAGREIHAIVDGPADVLRRQPLRPRPRTRCSSST